jgi:hypothetical protein
VYGAAPVYGSQASRFDFGAVIELERNSRAAGNAVCIRALDEFGSSIAPPQIALRFILAAR